VKSRGRSSIQLITAPCASPAAAIATSGSAMALNAICVTPPNSWPHASLQITSAIDNATVWAFRTRLTQPAPNTSHSEKP
jgi:hypothetical protein